MATTLYLATERGPVVLTRRGDRWSAGSPAEVPSASSIATDPGRPERVFCGGGEGVWRSDDAGASWRRVFDEPAVDEVTSLAVSPVERVGRWGVVYAGTEPSAVFRSEDGGASWRRCEGLDELPSAGEWSFPPRPETHHARWIEPDPHAAGRLWVAIEAGALISSPDGGGSWRDRVPGGPYDTHQLATHLEAPGRLWSAAGDGFFESDDGGDSWRRAEDGLDCRYCWSVAVDPGDPGRAVAAAAPGARQAHWAADAESAIYRREGDGRWQEAGDGLPPRQGSRTAVLAANPAEPGVFYAALDDGCFRSSDGGERWQRLAVELPRARDGAARVNGLVAVAI